MRRLAHESKIWITSAPDWTCFLKYRKQASVYFDNNSWVSASFALIKFKVLSKYYKSIINKCRPHKF